MSGAPIAPLSAHFLAEISQPISRPAAALCERVRAQYGDAVQAVLFYGSCLRSGTERDGILDIFLLVDDYAACYPGRTLAVANRLLPPNVFYFEMEHEGETLRTKYAVISLAQFAQRTSPACFHTFFWARFAQPCALAFARDAAARARVADILAGAATTFLLRVAPLLEGPCSAAALWTTGLSASYRTELRPERPGAARRLVDTDPARYITVTSLVADSARWLGKTDDDEFATAFTPRERLLARASWGLRRIQGKLINLARIMKAAYTFDGGVDYVLWKIERHSGVRVEASPMLRRHPLLACWPTVWKLYRAGAFR